MPKRKETIHETPNLYRSIGFVLGRLQTLVAFVPWQARKDFNKKFSDAIGRMPYPNEQGLVFHPEGVNKYWTECRLIFRATQREIFCLFLGYDWIVQGSDDYHWNINNNDFFFKLLPLGFRSGSEQDIECIRANVPPQFIAEFEQGIAKAKD